MTLEGRVLQRKEDSRQPSRRWLRFGLLSLVLVVGAARGGTDETSAALAATPSGGGGPEATQPLWAWPDFDDERFMVRGQSTYAWSRKFAFDAPYTGPQSLVTHPESSYTLSFTAYLGARLWPGGELYANPEAFQAQPLSNLFGLAGIQNGELQKASGPELRAYFARLFLRQSSVWVDVPSGFPPASISWPRDTRGVGWCLRSARSLSQTFLRGAATRTIRVRSS
jgi:hypothetical protein